MKEGLTVLAQLCHVSAVFSQRGGGDVHNSTCPDLGYHLPSDDRDSPCPSIYTDNEGIASCIQSRNCRLASVQPPSKHTSRNNLRSFDFHHERAEVSCHSTLTTYCSGSIYTSANAQLCPDSIGKVQLTFIIYPDLSAYHKLRRVPPVERFPMVFVFIPVVRDMADFTEKGLTRSRCNPHNSSLNQFS